MALKEHYKLHNSKIIKPYIKKFILIVLLMAIAYTFSSYVGIAGSNGILPIAKWSIKINNIPVTSNMSGLTSSISLLNVNDNTTQIDSGDTCYFEITIDPSTTEVSASYSFSVNLETASNLPEGTTIEKYEKYIYTDNTESLALTTDLNTTSANISENIMLSNTLTALESTSKVKYKFYCKVPFPTDMTEGETFTVTPNITVEQYISE